MCFVLVVEPQVEKLYLLSHPKSLQAFFAVVFLGIVNRVTACCFTTKDGKSRASPAERGASEQQIISNQEWKSRALVTGKGKREFVAKRGKVQHQ